MARVMPQPGQLWPVRFLMMQSERRRSSQAVGTKIASRGSRMKKPILPNAVNDALLIGLSWPGWDGCACMLHILHAGLACVKILMPPPAALHFCITRPAVHQT